MWAVVSVVMLFLGKLGSFLLDMFSEERRAKKKAVEDGKKAVDDGDTSGITAAFSRMRRK